MKHCPAIATEDAPLLTVYLNSLDLFSMYLIQQCTTPWQSVAIWGDESEVEFRVTGATHAWWHRDRFLTGLAWDNIAAGVLCKSNKPRSLLMLGLGGGTSLRTLRHLAPQLDITAVEIDSDMINLARKYMALDDIGAEIVPGDAYAWLRRNRRKFDVVFDDVYGVSATDVVRPEVYTAELRKALFRSMTDGGAFGVNLVIGQGHRTMQSTFRRFFRQNFTESRSITTPASLNECLMGAATLRPWREVMAHAKDFPNDLDYSFWRLLRARRLAKELKH